MLAFPKSSTLYGKKKIISNVEVKTYKKDKKHIEISALLCALYQSNYEIKTIKEKLEIYYPKPISAKDKFLLSSIVNKMCPNSFLNKIFENNQ